MNKIFYTLIFNFLFCFLLQAQPLEQLINVKITPNKTDWNYKIGEMATFKIAVYKNGMPLNGLMIDYQIGAERMVPMEHKTVKLEQDFIEIKATLTQPGFLRCIATVTVNEKTYKGILTVGFEPNKIIPIVKDPTDFDAFWNKNKKDLQQVPLDSKLILMPEKSSALTNVFQVNIQNIEGSRLYGILCIPKKPGKYPAILNVPGAGIRPYAPDLDMADKGAVVLSIGIHGIPVNLDPIVYNNLETGGLKGYFFFNAEHKDRYYYKRVYMGCVRAIDFLVSIPETDTARIAVTGNSQGGALSVITAALDGRVKYIASIHPALCDLPGYLAGRAGGWPHIFNQQNEKNFSIDSCKNALSYYDVVNFAKRLTAKSFFTWGFNDESCPPTSMHAAYNMVTSPKELSLYLETGHWIYPEQKTQVNNWIINVLKMLPLKN